MTLKVTMTINQDYSEDLIGLLTKAFGRGELGIGDIKIERLDPTYVATGKLEALPKSTAKWLGVRASEPKPKRKRERGLGMRAFKVGKPNGVIITLTALEHDASRDGISAMWKAHKLNPNGLSATLSKLKARAYVVQIDYGVWRLAPKGVEVVKQWRAQHDRANSE
jgi:hypothetical protein